MIIKKYGLGMIGFSALIVMLFIAVIVYRHGEDTVREAIGEARGYYLLNLQYREWNARVGGVYAPADKVAPNPYLDHPRRDVALTDGTKLTLVNPAYMTRMVFEQAGTSPSREIYSRLVSSNPLNPANSPAEWESAALQEMARTPAGDHFRLTRIDGNEYLQYLGPFVVEEACLRCHSHQGYQVGDLRGAISISIPMADFRAVAARLNLQFAVTLVVLWLFLSCFWAVLARRRFERETALRESEARNRTILQTAQVGIFMLDAAGTIIEANQRMGELFRCPVAELVGSSYLALIEDSEHEKVSALLSRAVEGSMPMIAAERHYIRCDGSRFWGQLNGRRLADQSGELLYLVGTIADIDEIKHVEEQLREANLRHNEAVRAANVGLWEWNLITNEVSFSAEWKHQIGYREDELENEFETWRTHLHPDDVDNTLRQVRVCIDGSADYQVEFRFRHKDESYRWILAQGSVLRSEKGTPLRMLGSHVDITARRRHEEDLKAQQQVLEAINTAQGNFISETTHRESFANLLKVLLELTESEYGFIGEVLANPETGAPYLKTFALTNIAWDDATRTFYEQNAPNGLEFYNLDTLFGVTLRTGEVTIANEPYSDPRRGGLPPGHPSLNAFLGIPLTIGPRMIGMAGVANRPGGYTLAQLDALQPLLSTIAGIIQAMIIDRERQQALAGLKESNDRFQLLLDSAAEAIIGIDREGSCIFCNQSSLMILGCVSDMELLGHNLHERMHYRADGSRLPLEECGIFQTLMAGSEVHLDTEYLCRGVGKVFPAELWAHPIVKENQVVGAVVSFIDITDRRALEEQNLRSSQLASVGELAAGVAHEINNPITGIINYAQLLLNGTTLKVSREEILERIIREGDRIAGIVRALLHLSRDTRGEFAQCQLADIVGNVLTLVRTQFEKDHIVVDCQLPDGLPPLLANSQQIEQVLLNLLHNSRYALNKKFADEQGERLLRIVAADVSPSAIERRCRVSVYDNGIGIPAELLPKVTNPFVTTKPAGVGTGLGLSLCQEVISHHGGSLRIESREGEFTEIIISLPFVA